MKALIDGDIIRYSSGFSVESTTYLVKAGKDTRQFDYAREAKKYLEELGRGELIPKKTIGPVEHALGNAKNLIMKILDATGSDEYQVYLTGKGNYRDDVATIKPYKGNRDTLHKPKHFDELTKYLIKVHGAVMIEGKEADDQMGIDQYGSGDWATQTCICSIDKDMNMIPGWHYNWQKDIMYYVTEDDAILWFYTQLIMGDKVDNIEGIPRHGPVKAYKILQGCETEEEMYGAVRDAYKKAGIPQNLYENAQLLWIQREEGVRWSPPDGTIASEDESSSE